MDDSEDVLQQFSCMHPWAESI